MRKKSSRKAPSLRKLNPVEEKEEIIYRRQLRSSWSFEPGMHPVDVWQREHAKEDE